MPVLFVQYQPNSAFVQVEEKPARCLAQHVPSYSEVGGSGKPGGVTSPLFTSFRVFLPNSHKAKGRSFVVCEGKPGA